MRALQSDAPQPLCEAGVHATRTYNVSLHQASSRDHEAMIAVGGRFPSDLRKFALQIRQCHQTLRVPGSPRNATHQNGGWGPLA
jgi:hypothetical protein